MGSMASAPGCCPRIWTQDIAATVPSELDVIVIVAEDSSVHEFECIPVCLSVVSAQ